ncbi:MAG: hypothetical protein DWP98_03830 [Bacteroidetes bacterium]|nr:MAG: hypothetical protein DWP98_03830 [Bacteroidota bacterium]MBL1144138.1 hypothetical protein [Bacteroidota bacterium]MCB0803831.1 hypothetical protein [Flavobacteriales bacterium]NOG56933.1 hypothetical protein [Bacteroidota bacterium]
MKKYYLLFLTILLVSCYKSESGVVEGYLLENCSQAPIKNKQFSIYGYTGSTVFKSSDMYFHGNALTDESGHFFLNYDTKKLYESIIILDEKLNKYRYGFDTKLQVKFFQDKTQSLSVIIKPSTPFTELDTLFFGHSYLFKETLIPGPFTTNQEIKISLIPKDSLNTPYFQGRNKYIKYNFNWGLNRANFELTSTHNYNSQNGIVEFKSDSYCIPAQDTIVIN